MPQFLVPVIIAIGEVAGVAISVAAAGYIAAGVVLLGTLAYSSYQKRKAERAQRAQYDASQVDRLANVPATIAPRELVLGRVRKGGNVFFRGSAGQFKQLFSMCITLAGHEIDGVEQVYFNNIPVSIDGSGNVTTAPYGHSTTYSATETATSGTFVLANTPVSGIGVVAFPINGNQDPNIVPFMPSFTVSGNTITIAGYDAGTYTYTVGYQYTTFVTVATVRWYLGAPGQGSDARLQGLFPGVWGPNHRADGIAYMVVDFVYDETAMPNGLPNVTALIRGAKCYDPRTGLTVFTENPALMMRHVMMHPQFGKRTAMTASEDARIIAAANACEVAISYTGTDSVATYRAGVVIPYGASARDALDDLSQSMGGQWAYAAGELYLRAGVYQLPVMNLYDADLAVVQRDNSGSISQNQITISTHKARADKVNSIVARIWDQAAGYVETPIYPFTPASYVAADGAVLAQEVTMPAVFYAPQAWAIAGIMLRDSRDPLTITLPFKLTAYPVEVFDGVTLTLARYGWVSKEFQVLGRTFLPDGIVQLTLKETSSAIYAYGAAFVPGGYASNTTLPKPWDISPPVMASLTSDESDLVVQSDGTVLNGVRVTWIPIQDASIASNGVVEIQWADVSKGDWQSLTASAGDTQCVFTGAPDNAVICVRLRAKNAIATSDWGLQTFLYVNGKSAAPPDIQNLTVAGSVLSWSMPFTPADLAGFVFRFHYGNNLDWNSATPLHTGVLTQSPYDLVTRPSGIVTIMGKAIDTSGNVSANTANIVMNLGDPTIANIVEQWDFNALSWPNSAPDSSGWTIVSGKPTANALDSFYGTDTQSFYGPDTDSHYDASAYAQMIFVTKEIAVSSALAGSVMSLVATTQGVDLRIEYRLAGPTAFYGPDGASFYDQTGTDPFYEAPGGWLPWPGQIVADRDVYQFRVTIGAGSVQGILQSMVLTIDAPDLVEGIANLAISSTGTVIPFTKPFASIKTIQATLQANGSGAVTVEVDKSVPLAPVMRAFNSSHVAVSGATADILLQGY
ncbi:phage tail protein [Variovorax ginsengisoli]|uniref:Phage tail protein n=1 Tax=Variovorax ginsengisoli TaxID=363844 RepID=A0ABT8SE43_9BURK|nr:phage tail protein [Variovorax ginsengisoli]MDN8617880.1 phage tail protein [Variovorax ginsengisoli]MDO1537050.1 phage tail protein [Variovorax ginsengisoli]